MREDAVPHSPTDVLARGDLAARGPAGSARDRAALALACFGACLAVVLMSGPNGGGTTWGDVDLYHYEFFDDAVTTRSLAGMPYPLLSLAPMFVAWLGGTTAWLVFSCACLSGTAVILARHSWSRGRPATVAYWWLGCVALLGPVALTRLEAPLSVVVVSAMLATSPVARGLLLGAAVWIKAWPIVLAAAVLRASRRAWAACAAVLVGLLVLGVVVFDDTLAWFTAQSGRSLQIESLLATGPMMLTDVDPRWSVVLRGGLEKAYAVDGPGTAVLARLGSLLVLLSVAAAALLVWRGRAWSRERVDTATVLLVLASFCLAPVLSPQFLVSIVAVVAAVSVVRGYVPGGWLLLVACAFTQAIYPWGYGSLVDHARWPIALLVIRQILLVAFAVVWVRRFARAPKPEPSAALAS